jgi:hypothetical protein
MHKSFLNSFLGIFFSLTIVVCFFLLFSRINITLAQDNLAKERGVQLETVNPDSFLRYNLKRLPEKIKLFSLSFFRKDQKVPYLIELTNKRLAEFSYVINNSKMSYLENSSSRYVTFIGLLSNEISKNGGYASQIKGGLESHLPVLIRLRDNYPQDTAEWRFVQQAYESTQVLLSNASK